VVWCGVVLLGAIWLMPGAMVCVCVQGGGGAAERGFDVSKVHACRAQSVRCYSVAAALTVTVCFSLATRELAWLVSRLSESPRC